MTWLISYSFAGTTSRLSYFLGNAIADWSGLLVIILGTKYLTEIHSAEGQNVKGHSRNPALNFVRRHSLLLFIIVTGLGWMWLYLKIDPGSKWGEVVGNILSNWAQMCGLVFFTKGLIERGSTESR